MRYDVFISFKKSTDSKSLTPEAIVAEKVYKLLPEKKIKALSRIITREAKSLLCVTLGIDMPNTSQKAKPKDSRKNEALPKTSKVEKASKIPKPDAKKKRRG